MSAIRFRQLSVAFVLGMFVAGLAAGGIATLRTDAAESKDSKLKRLQTEKLDLLQQIATQVEQMYDLRETGHKAVVDAQVAVYRAKLELCETDSDRIKILSEILDRAKERVTRLEAMPPSTIPGPVSGASLLLREAQVDRLNIEIEIERLSSK